MTTNFQKGSVLLILMLGVFIAGISTVGLLYWQMKQVREINPSLTPIVTPSPKPSANASPTSLPILTPVKKDFCSSDKDCPSGYKCTIPPCNLPTGSPGSADCEIAAPECVKITGQPVATFTPQPKETTCNVRPINGQCPPGCVNYGQPLGCITKQQYDDCHRPGRQYPCPQCLSSSTLIDTSNGRVNVTKLKVAMLVWSIDKKGNKVLEPILKLSSIQVSSDHMMNHLVVVDGRELNVSPGHPTALGKAVGELKSGELYDGSIVKSNDLVPYNDTKTYDLLPAGDTGYYFANGILIGSTLK